MNKQFFLTMLLLLSAMSAGATSKQTASPDGKLVVSIDDEGGQLNYSVTYNGNTVVEKSSLGFKADVGDFTRNVRITTTREYAIDKPYDMTRSKRAHVDFKAKGADINVENQAKARMTVNLVVANNDVAFRYAIPQQKNGEVKIVKVYGESTSFRFPKATTTFLSPQIQPGTGWKRSKPSYEEEYEADAPMDKKSKYGVGYTFPCLFNLSPTVAGKGEQLWAMVSETGVGSNYCGSRLSDFDASKGYTIAFPQEGENNGVGSTVAAMSLPATTPWRTITTGQSLKPIVETTIPFDVVEPLYEPSQDYQPGRYTWSWIIWQDNSVNYDDQVAFIDLAAQMGYEYCLVDGLWDKQIGRAKMERLAAYARQKRVRLLVWYNSNGYQNDAPQGPRDIMNNAIARKREMAWLKKMGVAGLKVDFFGGDKQETMRLYEEILSDANDYGLQIIFHGCTLPRGWERMYPNYVASEAALASENVFFSEHHARREGFEMAMHPFGRNAVGSFDWGGVMLNSYMSRDNKSRHQRFTTDAFEIATAVTNQTSVNCVAITPQALDVLEKEGREDEIAVLRLLPTTWTDTRFVDGYPTRYAVIARKDAKTGKWWIGGINGTDKPVTLTLHLPMLGEEGVAHIFTDTKEKKAPADNFSEMKTLKIKKNGKYKLTLQPMGGFVIF